MEVNGHGDAEADHRSEAEHQEGTCSGAAATDDRAPAGRGPKRYGPSGRARPSSRGQTGPRARGSHAPAALRGGQEEEHPRSIEDGEVGSRAGAAEEPVGASSSPRRGVLPVAGTAL